ncbi:MAG: FAD-binding protein [Planctomycetales bacterium]|nr:FAD-binding protein [Planctomycetales bacterium]
MKTAETIGAELAGLVRGDVRVDVYTRTAFSADASIYRIVPQCAASPKDSADIAAIVKYAHENSIPIAPRGAGSGLAGESLTSGIVMDVRRYLSKILQTAPDGSWVRVEPGVVLDDLNAHLSQWGRKIGPDPSSANRAVLGGVVGNNATGAHSLQYGYIADYVQSIRVVLADGTVTEFGGGVKPGDSNAAAVKAKACVELLADKQPLIENAQPRTKRNRCGYLIRGIVQDGAVNLARLMAGSEGTLAVFAEITLRTVPIPMAKGLAQLEFESFEAMAQAVPVIVESGVTVCEMMDRALMDLARGAFPKYREVLPANGAAALLIEHVGGSRAEVEAKIAQTVKAVSAVSAHHEVFLDEDQQALLWKSRKDAVPLLNRQKGDSHPVAFMEDVAVDCRRLGEYIAGIEAIAKKYHLQMSYYGHAGDGELHIRPYMDLRKDAQAARMRQMAQDVYALAWSLGGTISGEHADGLLHAAFIEAQYGSEYYRLLKGIKRIFDPLGILNPGKIIGDDPAVMTQNLRAMALAGAEGFQTELKFQPEEFRWEVEQCNGCGVCLARGAGFRMCPVFRGLDEELASTRAKADLLSAWMAGERFDAAGLKDILSLCVNCRMCSVECPAGVDVSKLVIEARTQLARQTGFTAAEMALSNNRWLSAWGAAFSPMSNGVMSLPIARWLLEKLAGLDRTRRLPHFERGGFIKKAQRYLKQQPPVPSPIDRVVYFVDSFANWNDHELGFSVLAVLRKLGVEVVVPPQRPAPLPAYVYGHIKTARQDMEYNLEQLLPYVEQGCRVVCSEPSAALCLRDETRLILGTDDARRLAQNTVELMQYISEIMSRPINRAVDAEKTAGEYVNTKFGYHAPCHLKALRSGTASIDLLGSRGLVIVDINGGCCGLAGTAGMQKKNRGLSDAIGRPLAQAIAGAGSDVIVTECAACGMQIKRLTQKPVMHPVKLLRQIV